VTWKGRGGGMLGGVVGEGGGGAVGGGVCWGWRVVVVVYLVDRLALD
jgi:hypothetical protein